MAAIKTIKCPGCGKPVLSTARVCPACGMKLGGKAPVKGKVSVKGKTPTMKGKKKAWDDHDEL